MLWGMLVLVRCDLEATSESFESRLMCAATVSTERLPWLVIPLAHPIRSEQGRLDLPFCDPLS